MRIITNRLACLIAICLLSNSLLPAQVYEGAVSLSSQTDVDNFPATFANTTKIIGYVSISGNQDDPIKNLDSLLQLTQIDGTLDIRFNDSLVSISGLQNIDTISSSLYLSRNTMLPNVDGLNNLNFIGENLEMSYNDSLTNVNGFSSLERVGEELLIGRLHKLQNIDGFQSLSYIGADLNLTFLPVLENIDGFSNFQFLGNELLIGIVDSIKNVDAFGNLERVGGTLFIIMNDRITNLDGLSNIQDVKGLRIDRNPLLTDCCGIFDLINNPGAIQGTFSISGNDTECETPEALNNYCDADGDGFSKYDDCDDENPAVYPGAVEICDGLDNDCSGEIDDNVICYCASEGEHTNYEWIRKVRFGDIKNKSNNDLGYGDYTALSTDVTPGESYKIRLKPGFSSGAFFEFWNVWIDWNQDGDFEDEGESVVKAIHYKKVVRHIEIPMDAKTGNTTMRVTMKYGWFPDPCETFGWGEVEDYTVNVLPVAGGIAPNDDDDTGGEGRTDEEINFESLPITIDLHPNPTTELLNVRIGNFVAGKAVVKIYNSFGQLMEQRKVQSGPARQTIFDISQFGEGVYVFLVDVPGQEQQSKPFVVVH